MMKLLRLLKGVFISKTPSPRPWTVDRDGGVRTDKDRPVMLRARRLDPA